MDHLQWPVASVGGPRHDKRKRKTSDGPSVVERLTREAALGRKESSSGKGTGNVSTSSGAGLIERQGSGRLRSQLGEVSEEETILDDDLEFLDDEPLAGSVEKAERYRDLKRRSSFSSTDLNLIDEDEQRKASDDGLISAPSGLVGDIGVSDSRINIGGGFRVDTPSPPLLSPIGPGTVPLKPRCNSWRLFVCLVGVICMIGLFASFAANVGPGGATGTNHNVNIPGGNDGSASSHSVNNPGEIDGSASSSKEQGTGVGEKDPAPPSAAGGDGSSKPANTKEDGIFWLATLLIGGVSMLACVAVGGFLKRRSVSEQVLMVHADDELHNVIEKARAEWRAGHFGADHGCASPHIEPNAAQRAWAAENIASLELS